MQRTVIGLDIGRSAPKTVAIWPDKDGTLKRHSTLFPSAVVPAFQLADEGSAAEARKETVLVNGKAFFVGKTAQWQGRDDMTAGLRDDWFFTDDHFALVLGSLQKLTQAGVPNVEKAILIAGLPGRQYVSSKTRYQAELSKHLPEVDVRVLPQPLGPFYARALTDQGEDREDIDAQGQYAVIEVGQFTTDLALIREGQAQQASYDSCSGMAVVADGIIKLLQAKGMHQMSIAVATETLERGFYKQAGKSVPAADVIAQASAELVRDIENCANRVLGAEVHRCDAIIVAGGGAPVIIDRMKAQWPHCQLLDDARYGVAEGFARFGLLLAFSAATA